MVTNNQDTIRTYLLILLPIYVVKNTRIVCHIWYCIMQCVTIIKYAMTTYVMQPRRYKLPDQIPIPIHIVENTANSLPYLVLNKAICYNNTICHDYVRNTAKQEDTITSQNKTSMKMSYAIFHITIVHLTQCRFRSRR